MSIFDLNIDSAGGQVTERIEVIEAKTADFTTLDH